MEHTEWKLWQNIFKEFLPFSASVDELPFLTGDIFLAEGSSSDFSLPLEWYSSIDRQAPPTKIESQWSIKTLKCWCCLLLWVLEDFSRIMLLNILYLFRLGGWVSFHCKIFFIFFFYMAFMQSSIRIVIKATGCKERKASKNLKTLTTFVINWKIYENSIFIEMSLTLLGER